MDDVERSILHHGIYREIYNNLSPSDFEDLKAASKPYLAKAVMTTCQNGVDICLQLENSGQISIGDYEVLMKILKSAGLIALLKRIEEMASGIKPDMPILKRENVDQNSLIHNKILLLINQDIHPSQEDFKQLLLAAGIYLHKAVVTGCKSGFDICCELEKAGRIEIGNYEALKKILELTGLIALKNRVEKEERKITKESGNHLTDSSSPHGGAEADADETHAKGLTGTSTDIDCASAPDVLLDPNQPDETIWRKVMSTVQNSIICREWKTLARELGVAESDINAIVHDNPELKEQCWQMIIKWRQVNGSKGTPNALIGALEALDFMQTAEDVMKCMPGAHLGN